jgi:hypothetical protein
MKVIGLEYPAFQAVLAKVDPYLKFTAQGSAVEPGAINYLPGVVEGFPSYPEKAPATWKCLVNGVLYHKPCGHRAMELIKACLDGGAKVVWFEKISFSKPLGATHQSKLMAKLQAKGITCKCPFTGQPGVLYHVAKAQAKATPAASGWAAKFGIPNYQGTDNQHKLLCGVCGFPAGKHYTDSYTDSVEQPVCPCPKCGKNPTLVNHVLKCGLVPEPVVTKPKPPKPVKQVKPLDGEPLTGETMVVPKGLRPTQAAVTGLYVLVELDRIVQGWRQVRYVPIKSSCTHRVDRWCEAPECPESYDPLATDLFPKVVRHRHAGDVCGLCAAGDMLTRERASKELSPSGIEQVKVQGGLAYYAEVWAGEDSENINVGKRVLFSEYVQFSHEYKARLARNLFDYMALASVQEAKYNHSGVAVPNYQHSIAYDQRTMLPAIESMFANCKFSGAYGGAKWANLAKSAGYYFKFAHMPVVFADHVVDITHNGGLMFNKGYIMGMPSESSYMAMLDHKKAGSLLDGKLALELTPEVFGYTTRILSHEMGSKRLRVKQVIPDVQVPFVKWGTQAFKLGEPIPETPSQASVGGWTSVESDESIVIQAETYPESRRKAKGK